MKISLPIAAALVCASGARAQEIRPLIERPPTLERGALDLTLDGTYTNWGSGLATGTSLAGESLALGVDYGANDTTQIGFALAVPINPGAGFGSVLGNILVALSPSSALRVDFGYERYGFNGDNPGGFANPHVNRFFSGLGARIVVPITSTVAFVTGRTAAVQLGPFLNIGDSGTGLYFGASALPESTSDFFVVSTGDKSSATLIAINLPAGLLFQPDPHVALTLLAGYSAVVDIPSGGSTDLLNFIPVGLEAVVTPAAAVDIGARFQIDGFVARTGGSSAIGYFDRRTLAFWLRFRV